MWQRNGAKNISCFLRDWNFGSHSRLSVQLEVTRDIGLLLSCVLCLFNLSLREQGSNQPYLPWICHLTNFYNRS